MKLMTTWFVLVIVLLGLVLALHHVGVDVTGSLGGALRSTEHVLGHPVL